jgi:superfamily II DNA or RNA helicase
MMYYHPKSGSETPPSIEYARVLTTTAQEVRRDLANDPSAPIMPADVKTLHDLLFRVLLNEDIPVKQILSMRSSTSVRSLAEQVFEGMWTIAFALGVVPGYESVTMLKGKVETGLTKVERSETLKFLKESSVATSSKSGASDISFSMNDISESPLECSPPPEAVESKKKRDLVFCSVKSFRNDDKKSVDQYDVTNIISAALAGKYAEDEFRVLILANDKAAVKSKFASAIRRYITYIVKKDTKDGGVLGRDDLEAAFVRLRDRVRGVASPEDFLQETFLGAKKPRSFLSLRFHQELVVKKTLEIIKEEGRTSVLWGVVARGGKTYITGGLIRDAKPKTVFIVAGAYTETHTQFLDDLLDVSKNGMQDFAEYTVVDVKNDAFKYDPSKKYIFFMSLELLKLTGSAAKKRSVMNLVETKTIVPDMVFFDEIHKGGTTLLADKAVEIIAHSSFKVFMTATYIKPFIKPEYKLDAGNLITWGYEDILTAKSMDSPDTVVYFEKKYGSDVCRAVLQYLSDRGVSTLDIATQYQKFPEIQFLTTAFSEEFEASMTRQNVIDTKTGFKMSTLFAVGKECMKMPVEKRWECFTSPATVGLFLNYMGPANAQMSSLPGGSKVHQLASPDEHITDRIGRTSQRRGDRLKNIEKEFKPHSQLWFLPQASGDGANDKPLLSMMSCLASILCKHPWFRKNFCVVCVSSGFGKNEADFNFEDGGFVAFTNGGTDTKKTVLEYEKKAYEKGRGLIILAGRMLTLGVSLPCVNVVALLDDSASSDLTYQKMFRALTESEGKTVGYIVDVNPIRTLKTLYDYTSVEHRENEEHTPVTVTTLTNMYLIDEDKMFVIGTDGKRLTSDDLHKKLDTYLQASRKIYKTIFAEASANIAAIDLAEEFGILHDALNRSKPEALGLASDLAGTSVPSGVERVAEPAAPKPSKKSMQEEMERMRSLREMVLTSMTLLAFLTTDIELSDAFERYKNNEDGLQGIVYDTIVDRGLATEGADAEKIKNVLISAMSKTMVKLMEPYRKMRTQLSEFSGDQKEVIEFIETNLKPKKEQVAARGEVFTPLELVSDMLGHLPDDVWKHPEYKWLDPAGGLGQFPVIAYAKLDAGLKSAMPDDIKRRKHIVENMLFIVELDNTNVELSRTLLQKMCGAPGCKLNLLKHDFLTATDSVMLEKFGVNRFDVIMGNPPYNAGGVVKGGGALWPKFVKRSFELINPSGFIVLVHPPGWRKFNDPEERENQGTLWRTIRDNKWSLRYINVSDEPRFVSTKVITDYYVIQASPSDAMTQFTSKFGPMRNEGMVDTTLQFIPNMINPETVQIIKKLFALTGTPIHIIRNQSFQPTEADKRAPGIPHYRYTTAKGEKAIYFKEYAVVPAYINKPKVLMTYSSVTKGQLFAFYSEEQMGTADNSMYMSTSSPEEGARLVEFFNSDVITFLMKITQYSEPPNNKNEFKILNQIKLPASMDEIKLTPEESDLVQRIVRPAERSVGSGMVTPRNKSGVKTTRRKMSK